MLCPLCKSELIVAGQERLETLSEHVSNPNGTPSMKDKYECSNDKCQTRGKAGICWNVDGELYSSDYKASHEINYIDDNDGPFGSRSRRINVEICKKNLHKYTKSINIGPYSIMFEYVYKANEDGEVLSTKKKLEIRKYSNEKITSYSTITPFWRALYYKWLFRKMRL